MAVNGRDIEPNLAVSVRKAGAEDARKELRAMGLTDDSRKIIEKGDSVEIPVKGLPRAIADRFEIVVQEDPQFRPETKDPFDRILASVELEPALREVLPRRWELVGDILLVKLPKELMPFKEAVSQAYARELGARAVLNDLGIAGELRRPKLEHLWGDANTETVHTENKVRFALDPMKVMFSSGNIDERIHMATVPRQGETVVDMFAGLGYFSIPIAVHSHAGKVIALEKNQDAFAYLMRNAEANGVQNKVEAILGDNRNAPEKVADRVIMGYLPSPRDFLPKAIKILKRNKRCVIHYHENAPEAEIPGALFSRVAGAAGAPGRGAKLIGHRWIKSYAPKVWHAVVDVEIL